MVSEDPKVIFPPGKIVPAIAAVNNLLKSFSCFLVRATSLNTLPLLGISDCRVGILYPKTTDIMSNSPLCCGLPDSPDRPSNFKKLLICFSFSKLVIFRRFKRNFAAPYFYYCGKAVKSTSVNSSSSVMIRVSVRNEKRFERTVKI